MALNSTGGLGSSAGGHSARSCAGSTAGSNAGSTASSYFSVQPLRSPRSLARRSVSHIGPHSRELHPAPEVKKVGKMGDISWDLRQDNRNHYEDVLASRKLQLEGEKEARRQNSERLLERKDQERKESLRRNFDRTDSFEVHSEIRQRSKDRERKVLEMQVQREKATVIEQREQLREKKERLQKELQIKHQNEVDQRRAQSEASRQAMHTKAMGAKADREGARMHKSTGDYSLKSLKSLSSK